MSPINEPIHKLEGHSAWFPPSIISNINSFIGSLEILYSKSVIFSVVLFGFFLAKRKELVYIPFLNCFQMLSCPFSSGCALISAPAHSGAGQCTQIRRHFQSSLVCQSLGPYRGQWLCGKLLWTLVTVEAEHWECLSG